MLKAACRSAPAAPPPGARGTAHENPASPLRAGSAQTCLKEHGRQACDERSQWAGVDKGNQKFEHNLICQVSCAELALSLGTSQSLGAFTSQTLP